MLGAFLGHVLRVVLLDLRRVLQHDRRQVTGGEGAIDVALEALTAEVGQVPAMIDMRVAENHGIQVGRFEGEIPVPLDGLVAMPLVESNYSGLGGAS